MIENQTQPLLALGISSSTLSILICSLLPSDFVSTICRFSQFLPMATWASRNVSSVVPSFYGAISQLCVALPHSRRTPQRFKYIRGCTHLDYLQLSAILSPLFRTNSITCPVSCDAPPPPEANKGRTHTNVFLQPLTVYFLSAPPQQRNGWMILSKETMTDVLHGRCGYSAMASSCVTSNRE